jgi:hypothetical protein
MGNRQIQSIQFSNTYQVLLCCGCDTKIDILDINP